MTRGEQRGCPSPRTCACRDSERAARSPRSLHGSTRTRADLAGASPCRSTARRAACSPRDVIATIDVPGVRSRRDGRLRAARRRDLGRDRVQPARASGRRPGAARPAIRRRSVAPASRRAHHDRRADPAGRRRRGAGRVRVANASGKHRDHAAGRTRPARRRIAARTSRAGAIVLRAGRRLRPQDVGLVASLGQARVDAVAPSRACASSSPATRSWLPARRRTATRSTTRTRRCCAASSRATAACSSARCGSATILRAIRDALAAPGADVILVSGGSSVGSEDHAPRLVAEVRRARDPRRRDAAVEPRGRRTRSATRSCSCCPAIPCRACARTISSPGARSGSAAGAAPTGRIARGSACVARKIVSAIGRVDYCRVRVAGRRGRAARAERRVDPVVDDARRRLRHRSRRERRLRSRQRSHRVPVRLMTHAERRSDAEGDPARRSSSTSSRATRRRRAFSEHLQLAPLGVENVPLGAALGRVLAEDIVADVDVPGLRPLERRRLRRRRRATRSGAMEERRAHVRSTTKCSSPGVAPPSTRRRRGHATPIATGGMLPRGADAVADGRAHRRRVPTAGDLEITRARSRRRERQLRRHRHRARRDRACAPGSC